MAEIVWGTASGLLMGIVFVGVSAVMLLAIAKEPPAWLKGLLRQVPVVTFVVPLVFLSQAVWALIGLILGIFYRLSVLYVPGPGAGSSNLVYTLGVIVFAGATLLPLFILARRVFRGVLILVLAFVSIFGWFLPLVVSWR